MADKTYGTVQVCEIRLSACDIEAILAEYVQKVAVPSYFFDTQHPIFVWDKEHKNVTVRYVTTEVTRESEPRSFTLTAIERVKLRQ